ncbi:MAG: hypothetical protein HY430_04055 [Candidatus Levybacteria bacterium]|nr:hypothetical protein [Candidatus Levybacteria bacterium]
MKKQLVFPAVAAAVLGVTMLGAVSVSAQTTNPNADIVTKIAQKFGLKESDVQTVFDEVRTQHFTQNQARFEEYLTQAVKDGKLTEVQKQAVLAKHKELFEKKSASREAFMNMTAEQRKAEKEKLHADMKAWADANGIDLQYVFGGLGHHGFVKNMKMMR